jgi:superfamily II DNA or RNA helicase
MQTAPEYRGRFGRIWLWDEWPEAWGADAGIDLVAEEVGGDLWAVQAKAYDPAYAIRKADVDSFLSESSRALFSYRLLIATTDGLGARARRTLESQREPVGYLLRSQLDSAPVDWPSSPEELRPSPLIVKEPLPHVLEAITATCKGLERADRGKLIMACGTGKTLGAMWIAERLRCTRTLILVPSLSLLGQTLREWRANASEPFDYLAVCSDATVTGEDEFVRHTAELGLPVTTAPDQIAAFLRRRGRRVVFATYQSSLQVAAACGARTPSFDLAIADEAHRCAGRTAGVFGTILDARQIKAKRRLFMTATPRYFTPRMRREAGVAGVEIASMDDESVFGPVLHELSFGEAIERNQLSDYQVVVVGVDDETLRTYAERGELITREGEKPTDARTLAGQVGLAKAMGKYDLRRVISFHGRVKSAREFSIEMPNVIAWMPSVDRPAGPVWSEHVSGAMSSGHRDRLISRFRHLSSGERGLLSNARCLGEGVDVPTLDAVAFVDPRRSTIDIIQAVGRAIRKAPDKAVGTILLPVFVGRDEDAAHVLDSSAFRHVWDVVKALRAHDSALGEELDTLRRRLGARGETPGRPGKIMLDLPIGVGVEFARAFDARLVERTTSAWEFHFGLLQRFIERVGHARPRSDAREGGYRLGEWTAHQRAAFQRGELEAGRQERLDALPGWHWNIPDAEWETGLSGLQAFVTREGHAEVPHLLREDGFRLGQWIGVQRKVFREGRLDSSRRERLDAIPGWSWDIRAGDWEEGFARLESFIKREGTARVPKDWTEDGYPLGGWTSGQRNAFKSGRLDPERRIRLEALPKWRWNLRHAAWDEGFASLSDFARREGHTRVPKEWREDGYRLGQWTTHQRAAFRRGQLDTARSERLATLPGWSWHTVDSAWEEAFGKLETFVAREGHAQVPFLWRESGFSLGGWVNVQRGSFRRGQLDDAKSKRLEALTGWSWGIRDDAWDQGITKLESFVTREGHARVPGNHAEGDFRLGAWVVKQRSRRASLEPDRRARLEAVRGWAWDARDAAWEEAFSVLQKFVAREGHSRVTAQWREGDYGLGGWIVRQRVLWRDGRLEPKRRERLDASLGWEWAPSKGPQPRAGSPGAMKS